MAVNVVNVQTINGRSNVQVVSNTYGNLVTNQTGSGQLYKVNFVTMSNTNSSPVLGTVDFYRNSTSYAFISNAAIPGSATLTVIGKDTAVYLEEGDTIRCYANLSANVNAVCSYEIIS